ncbi:MAG: universal stress protein [Candidatus Nitrosocaldus sp.]|nr:universal stress protein [Candidatus Nitrosocaldus sp.]MCS7141262.1 universal stress protein [Candidatus Nitrosocaldus sp.]MDW8000227.1 universal stress protein [Candidatus Nitrosocaldus sp.]MDW8275989.1 universal stress protein [Candidatus Nitrosocaldus sp.]
MKILVAIDGSEQSFKAARFAIDMARRLDASIVLLHVIGIPQFPHHLGSLDEYYRRIEGEVEGWFNTISNWEESRGMSIGRRIIHSHTSIVESIVEYAEEEGFDMIVVGTRGRSRFMRALLGSVAQGVITYARCPVLVVR